MVQQSIPANAIVLNVTFSQAPSIFDIQKAVLRYNKDFAYSLTLDDGLRDAYTCGFPLLNGGYMAANNTTYPGLKYTDGCGNDVKFTGGLSWFSLGGSMNDIHQNSTNYINWNELQNMINNGWNVFNHTLQHAAGAGTDYVFQIVENTNWINNKTGITPTQFVVPSGDQNYVAPAFANGMSAVYGNNSGYSGYPNGLNVKDPMNFTNFKVFKRFLYDDYYNPSNITQHIDNAAALSVNGNHYWYNDFTHRVAVQSYGGSLLFSTFEYYMNYIANTYGKNGTDRVWMAPLQDVFEYMQVRDKSVISTSLTGNTLQIIIDRSNVPDNLLKNALSLIINANANIVSVVANQPLELSFNGTASTKLINLEWAANNYKSGGKVGDDSITQLASKGTSDVWSVYPNPAKDFVTFSSVNELNGDVEVISPSAGLVSKTKVVAQHSIEVDLNALANGIYILRYVSRDGTVVRKKFVKQ